MKRVHNRFPFLTAAALALCIVHSASAGPVGGLVDLQNGTIADANDVMVNFNTIKGAIDDNDARLGGLEAVRSAPGYVRVSRDEFVEILASPSFGWIYHAPIHLPHGAVLEEMNAYFSDSEPEDIRVTLKSTDPYLFGSASHGRADGLLDTGLYSVSVGLSDTVDNVNRRYY